MDGDGEGQAGNSGSNSLLFGVKSKGSAWLEGVVESRSALEGGGLQVSSPTGTRSIAESSRGDKLGGCLTFASNVDIHNSSELYVSFTCGTGWPRLV